ncbi:hypothetical protein HMI55_004808, partial [Coelomomyces lativittatus]
MEDCPHESGIFQVPINYKLICGLNKTIKLESYSFQVTYKNDPSKYDELDQYLETQVNLRYLYSRILDF